ncbi:MAG: helix-turn-helix transcriptional regulator [Bacteroidaceae bacterium]|nr:helix-turn-helix transcriptional regulator [Bacteroidaceae bacterium]
MKTNKIMDEIRSTISPEMKMQMELTVAIANRIYSILETKGMSQKEFARLMGKTETEVSRWLSGTHNLTIATICKISAALNEDVIRVANYSYQPVDEYEPMVAAEPSY